MLYAWSYKSLCNVKSDKNLNFVGASLINTIECFANIRSSMPTSAVYLSTKERSILQSWRMMPSQVLDLGCITQYHLLIQHWYLHLLMSLPSLSLYTASLPCLSSPCENDGVCLNTGDGYECSCVNNYVGPKCETCKYDTLNSSFFFFKLPGPNFMALTTEFCTYDHHSPLAG